MENKYIYFGASIRGGRDDLEIYQRLIKHLNLYGKVLTEHIGNPNLSIKGEDGLSDIEIHDRDMGWLTKSNTLVAEVTQASLGLGYEIGRMIERNIWIPSSSRKNIFCLYRPQIDKRLSAMIAGTRGLKYANYKTLDEAKKEIDKFFESIKGM